MSDDPLDEEQIPSFSDDMSSDMDEGNGGLMSKLKGIFKKKNRDDAFGADVDSDDPFALQENEDAMFARRRKIMGMTMVVGLALLIAAGVTAFTIDWSGDEEPEVAEKTEAASEKSHDDEPENETSSSSYGSNSSGTRVSHKMPVASGPEDLNQALIRPPGSYNPDAARRAGSLSAKPVQAPSTAQKAAPQKTAEITAPKKAEKPTQVASVNPGTTPSEVVIPVLPPARTNFTKHDAPPRLSQLAKLDGVKFAMKKAPQPDLQKRLPSGRILPSISPTGRKPWQAYALQHKAEKGKPQIAVILRGLGLSKTLTTAAVLRTPPQFTLAFSPYAVKLNSQLMGARKYGHETLLTIGLETKNFPTVDPGPEGLFTGLSVDENTKRLETSLSGGTVYQGILISGGDVYAASIKHMAALLSKIKEMGLVYIAPNATTAPFNMIAAKPARSVADVIIPDETFRSQISAYLLQAETIARAKGKVTILADTSPLSLKMLTTWKAKIKERGFQFAPISAVVDQ